MRLDLDDHQRLLVDTARRFLADGGGTAAVRARHEAGGGADPAWWAAAAELGWTGLLVPEASGGWAPSPPSLGVVELALVAEVLGGSVAPGPLHPVSVVADALVRAGTPAQQARWLPGLVAGGIVAAWAHAPVGVDDVVAERSPDGWRLRGTVAPVEAAAEAALVLVTAATPQGPTQLLVPLHGPGRRVEALESLDLVRTYGAVHLDDVVLDDDAVLGAPGGAAALLERQLALALVLQAAEATGSALVVLEATVAYLVDRTSFGRPLASYQALQHRVADLRLWVEAAQATTDAAVDAVAHDAPGALRLARIANGYVGDRLPELVQDCVQLHGSIGVTWEHDLHLHLRRITVDRVALGDPAHQRRAVGLAVLEEAARG